MISLKHPAFLIKEMEKDGYNTWVCKLIHRQTHEKFDITLMYTESDIVVFRQPSSVKQESFVVKCYRYYIWVIIRNAIKECLEKHPTYRLPLLTGTTRILFPRDEAEGTVPQSPPRSFWAFWRIGYPHLSNVQKWMIIIPGIVSLITLIWHPPFDTLLFLGMATLQGVGLTWLSRDLYRCWRKMKKHGLLYEHE